MPCALGLIFPQNRTSGCQFDVAEDELIEFAGRNWCLFHLPVRAGDVESEKSEWDSARIDKFNKAIFDRIDEAKSANVLVNLARVVFPQHISFEQYNGDKNSLPSMQLDRAEFVGDVFFRDFGEDAWFDGVIFRSRASFAGSTFGGEARFREVKFHRYAQFSRAIFSRDVCFMKAKFMGDAWFRAATFGGRADFRNAIFQPQAYFHEATFKGDVWFQEATFNSDAWFPGKPTVEGADIFPMAVGFRGASFKRRAVFNNRRFLDSADFCGATFSIAPEFHQAVLHQDTSFDRAKFLDCKGTDEVDAARAYRTLKLAMASVRATDEEASFYGYEQQSIRSKPDTSRTVKMFSRLYELTADYGQSLALPGFWLLYTALFLFPLLYAFLFGPAMWVDGVSVLRFTLQQVFQPFSTFRSGAVVPGVDQAVPLGLALLSAAHSLLTLSFLTLFLLALRRRFRLN